MTIRKRLDDLERHPGGAGPVVVVRMRGLSPEEAGAKRAEAIRQAGPNGTVVLVYREKREVNHGNA